MSQWKKKGVKGFLVYCEAKEMLTTEAQNTCYLTEEISEEHAELNKVLLEFVELFHEPKSLPPSRQCDHEIPLIPQATPVNTGPYRYSYE